MNLSSPWWLPPPPPSNDSLRDRTIRHVRAVFEPSAGPGVGRLVVVDLARLFAVDRLKRRAQLRALVELHAPRSLSPQRGVAVPPRLWDHLLLHVGESRPAARRIWPDEPGVGVHAGVSCEHHTALWGDAEAPGAAYDDQLWAWGGVHQTRSAPPLPGVSARLTWRSDTERWIVHPSLIEAFRGCAVAPRLHEGPGLLLACVVDAIVELCGDLPVTARDQAVLWGTCLLPLTATTSRLDSPQLRTPSPTPAFAHSWPFCLLHPRIQSALLAIDGLCTLVQSHDVQALQLVLRSSPIVHGAHVDRGVDRLLHAIIAGVLRRGASTRWDSGFGFRLFRGLARQVLDVDDPVACWDELLHGEQAGRQVGALAWRLQEAASTALMHPGRPKYSLGPASRQLIDLIWLRWTDPTFFDLGE